jgi:murein DD-endopeptidase MepM/ murein hydrolase activator NlpD
MSPTKGASHDHKGVDIDAPSGTPVYSPLDGTITKSLDTTPNGCGGHIRIDHGGGIETKYCHLKQMVVKPGDKVKRGEHIGYTGGGDDDPGRGISTGPHLHYEVLIDGEAIDPAIVQPELA